MTVLHTCWLTDPWKSSRDKYLAAWVKAGFDVNLWHIPWNSKLVESPVPGVTLCHAMDVVDGSRIMASCNYAVRFGDHGTASDLFRYEVLCQFGGAYADLDVWPKAAAKFNGFVSRNPLFGDHDRIPLEIRFILTPESHPLMERIRDAAVKNEEAWIADGGWMQKNADAKGVLLRTAPDMVLPLVKAWATEHNLNLEHFILKDAVDETTIEQRTEHFNAKLTRAKELAKKEPGYATFKIWEKAARQARRFGGPVPERPKLW